MDKLFGIKIIQSKYAVRKTVKFVVKQCSGKKKRRKSWVVSRVLSETPECWRTGDIFIMHPDLFARLKGDANAPLAHFANAK